MKNTTDKYDVIIIGGSFAGLSAGIALARSLRTVLIIDSKQPCNKQTPKAHNFIFFDGENPLELIEDAKHKVSKYPGIVIIEGFACKASKNEFGFEVELSHGTKFISKKLVFATGVRDLLPDIPGLSDCWGITAYHCPFCHAFEIRNEPMGILANGDAAYSIAKVINQWSQDLYIFTNGESTLTEEQKQSLISHHIKIIESPIKEIKHTEGSIDKIVFDKEPHQKVVALFIHAPFTQSSDIPIYLNCEITDSGLVKTDDNQKTSIRGVYAAGDCTSHGRAISIATASGTVAGIFLNKEMIEEEW